MLPKGDGPSSALVNRPKAGVPASVYNDKWLVQYETEAARDDDNQNTKNEIVFSLSKFCHKTFKYHKAFLD